MKKLLEVEIKDINIAKSMLQIAGYYDVHRISDEEIFNRVVSMIDTYGATWKVIKEEEC